MANLTRTRQAVLIEPLRPERFTVSKREGGACLEVSFDYTQQRENNASHHPRAGPDVQCNFAVHPEHLRGVRLLPVPLLPLLQLGPTPRLLRHPRRAYGDCVRQFSYEVKEGRFNQASDVWNDNS